MNKLNNNIEIEYCASCDTEHRKKFAQFFTPYDIADIMSAWLLSNKNLNTVLEPAFGLGIFSRIILSKRNVSIKGFEIDKRIYDTAVKEFYGIDSFELILRDYMFNDWENKYDGIICNPPYFKFHDYDNKVILNEFEKRLGYKFNGFTNLYTLFLLKSIHQLEDNGRLAYIVPSEFMNSDYGKLIKSFIINSGVLRHIAVIDFKENIFDDAMTTASVIFCAKDNYRGKIQFHNVKNKSDFNIITEVINKYPKITETKNTYNINDIDPNIKWKSYYQTQNSIKYKNLVPFAHYAKVCRGIATGDNEYFTFNEEKIFSYKIPKNYLSPCVTKANHVQKPFFGINDFNQLSSNNKRVYILDPVELDNTHIKKYIQYGEEQGVNKKFLTSRRSPWYSRENREPAPIWVSVFSRDGLKFIKNEANILNLTAFHGIYPKNNLLFDIDIDLLFAYLLTNTAKEIFIDNSREYGNGLTKFEPNDINNSLMADINLLSQNEREKIIKLLNEYRLTADNKIIKEIDNIIINIC